MQFKISLSSLTAVVQDGQPYELYHVVSISSHDQFNSTVREGF